MFAAFYAATHPPDCSCKFYTFKFVETNGVGGIWMGSFKNNQRTGISPRYCRLPEKHEIDRVTVFFTVGKLFSWLKSEKTSRRVY